MIVHRIRYDPLRAKLGQGMPIRVTLREDSLDPQVMNEWCALHRVEFDFDIAYSGQPFDKWQVRYMWLVTEQQQISFKLTWHTGEPAWPKWPKEHA